MIAIRIPEMPVFVPPAPVPSYLVYETMDGLPVYYKGYLDVLAGKKNAEEIMGSSTLQTVIIEYLLGILFSSVQRKDLRILTNEAGLHLDRKNNLSGDILVFDAALLPVSAADQRYASVAPLVNIEVDIDAHTGVSGEQKYINKKTSKLLHFGVGKVIWIFTTSREVMVALPGETPKLLDWNQEIELIQGITFNIGAYLKANGSRFA